jgi:hypothetical protein
MGILVGCIRPTYPCESTMTSEGRLQSCDGSVTRALLLKITLPDI